MDRQLFLKNNNLKLLLAEFLFRNYADDMYFECEEVTKHCRNFREKRAKKVTDARVNMDSGKVIRYEPAGLFISVASFLADASKSVMR